MSKSTKNTKSVWFNKKKKRILVIEALKKSPVEGVPSFMGTGAYPTGNWMAISANAAKRIFKKDFLKQAHKASNIVFAEPYEYNFLKSLCGLNRDHNS